MMICLSKIKNERMLNVNPLSIYDTIIVDRKDHIEKLV